MMGFVNLADLIDGIAFGDAAQVDGHTGLGQHDAVVFRTKEDILIVNALHRFGQLSRFRNVLMFRPNLPEIGNNADGNIPLAAAPF